MQDGGDAGQQQRDEEEEKEEGAGEGGEGEAGGEKKKSAAVTLPYVAQDNLELLTVDLVERCLDSTYGGGDLLGQHPETGEDVGSVMRLAGLSLLLLRFSCSRCERPSS